MFINTNYQHKIQIIALWYYFKTIVEIPEKNQFRFPSNCQNQTSKQVLGIFF